MKIYLTAQEAVRDLHEYGFTNDLQVIGNNLYCVQKKNFIRDGEYIVLEYHKITEIIENEEYVVFGIVAPRHHIKGILLYHHTRDTDHIHPLIIKKLHQLNNHTHEQLFHIGKDILNNDPEAN